MTNPERLLLSETGGSTREGELEQNGGWPSAGSFPGLEEQGGGETYTRWRVPGLTECLMRLHPVSLNCVQKTLTAAAAGAVGAVGPGVLRHTGTAVKSVIVSWRPLVYQMRKRGGGNM